MKQLTHIHHIVPRHMGGSNDPSNLVELSVEEHALAHKRLYEEFGRHEDRIAWLTLSGQITKEAARREVVSLVNTGRKFTAEHRKKLSDAHKGHKHSEATKQKQREASLRLGLKPPSGRRGPRSEEVKRKLSLANKGQIPWNKGKRFAGVA